MDHIERIEREFTHRAGTFEAYVEKAAGDTVAMFCEALGEAGRDAGMGLAVRGDEITFFHRWALIVADKPLR